MKNNDQGAPSYQETAARLSDALLRMKRASALLCNQIDMSMLELSALRRMAHNHPDSDRNVFAQDLAEDFAASKAAVSQMLSNMERQGLLQRDFNPANRRKLIITLTDEGRRVVGETEALFLSDMTKVIEAFGEEEACALAGELERLCEIVDILKPIRE